MDSNYSPKMLHLEVPDRSSKDVQVISLISQVMEHFKNDLEQFQVDSIVEWFKHINSSKGRNE